jgi:hypothetical protein
MNDKMDKPTVSDLQVSFKGIDIRVSAQEAMSKIIEQRLEDLSESIAERFAAKDERVNIVTELSKSVNSQNDILQRQLTGRWGYITGMIPVVLLAFLLNFGYGVSTIDGVTDAKQQ